MISKNGRAWRQFVGVDNTTPTGATMTHEERLALIYKPLTILRPLPIHGTKGNCGRYAPPESSGGFLNRSVPYAEPGR